MSRDAQKSKVYSAEHFIWKLLDESGQFPTAEAFGSTVVLPPELRFGDLAAVQKYVNRVLAMPEVKDRWSRRASLPVVVRERRGNAKAHYEYSRNVIAIPVTSRLRDDWAMREVVVLHEIAHHLSSVPDHGEEFVGILEFLLGLLLGPELGLLYADACHSCDVKWQRGV